MFDKQSFFAALRGLKPGQFIEVPATDFDQADDAANEFQDRYSVQLSMSGHGILRDGRDQAASTLQIYMDNILPGSPLTARTVKPWHGLAVGETAFVPEGDVLKLANLRAYVSIHGAKVGHSLSVVKADGGYKIERKAS